MQKVILFFRVVPEVLTEFCLCASEGEIGGEGGVELDGELQGVPTDDLGHQRLVLPEPLLEFVNIVLEEGDACGFGGQLVFEALDFGVFEFEGGLWELQGALGALDDDGGAGEFVVGDALVQEALLAAFALDFWVSGGYF
jgi:hypothetical protein